MEGPLLEAKVKARGDLDSQSHTNPAKRKTVNPTSFSIQAPILQTLLDTVNLHNHNSHVTQVLQR